MRKLFGTDGVRGIANLEPMTSETAMQLGRAAAHIFKRRAGRHQIVIGKDTRVSGYMLEAALVSGICSMGVDVLLVGPMPTPAIAFLARSLRADAGVILNASMTDYRVPRIDDVPPLEVILLDRPELPSAGAGETPIIAIAPAVANAIFAATGVRLRSMPLVPDGVVPELAGAG